MNRGREPLDWEQQVDDTAFPYEARHGGLTFHIRYIGMRSGHPVYCYQVEIEPRGLFKFCGESSVIRLRRKSRRDIYRVLSHSCACIGLDFAKRGYSP